jgi:PiT family inorganic phosphate transporter
MTLVLALFVLIIAVAFAFGITNGFTSGGGLVAMVVTTRAMQPLPALLLVAGCEMIGVVLLGSAVSRTLVHDFILWPAAVAPVQLMSVLVAAFLGALIWNTAMWFFALPTSSSHAMVGGMVGAILLAYGTQAIRWEVFTRIFLVLGLIPLAGILAAVVLSRGIYWVGEFLAPNAKKFFRGLEIVSLIGASLVQGNNDGQKCLAMMLMALGVLAGAGGLPPSSLGPLYLLCGGSMALGVIFGSRRIIGTLGKRLYRLQELQGFCAQTSTMLLVGSSSLLGYPLSTSQVMATSVVGAGVAVQPRDIRWNVVGEIGVAWLVTIPASAALAAGLTWVMRYVVS